MCWFQSIRSHARVHDLHAQLLLRASQVYLSEGAVVADSKHEADRLIVISSGSVEIRLPTANVPDVVSGLARRDYRSLRVLGIG